MSEPAYEVSIEELHRTPALLDKAVDSAIGGRVVALTARGGRHIADVVRSGLLEELEETVAVLSDSDAVRALSEGREAAARGDVVRGTAAVRGLLDERQ